MFCQQCGKEIPDGSRFCTSCGAPAPDVTAESQNTGYIPPVSNENTSYQTGYVQPAYNGGYNAAYPAEKTAKRRLTRWPAGIGVMAVLYLAFYLASLVPTAFYYTARYMSIGSFLGSRIIYIVLAIAVPVLFFVHTRKLAFLTAIPMFIQLILSVVSTFQMPLRMLGSYSIIQNVVPLGIQFILVVLYILQMTIRPGSAAMPVVYLIFSIIGLLISAFFIVVMAIGSYMPGDMILGNIINFVASVFLSIAYIMAMFRSRKG